MSTSTIQQYFEDKTVLITGATGFVGKVLLQKLLRTCQVKKVFVTMRSKKNKNAQERLEDYFQDGVHKWLKEERNGALKKVEVVAADMSAPGLGISEEDRELIKNEVNVVFHTAATLRFDEPLRVAANTNVRGTQEVMELCLKIKNLSSIVYVSTAFSFCIEPELFEVFNPAPLKTKELLTIVDTFNDDVLELITPKLLGVWPNTYIFTKCIAENCVRKLAHDLPAAIVRPSIISGAYTDPTPGWIDSFLGATGVFVGTVLGAIRTLHCKMDNVADLIPVDYVANCLMAVAADVSRNDRNTANHEDVPIYNCTTSYQNPITWRQCCEYGRRYAEAIPSSRQIWHVIFLPCSSKYVFLLLHFLLHIVPAYIVDFFALCLGKKPQMVKGYEKVTKSLDVLSFFTTREWIFYNTKTQELWKKLSESDRALYPFDVGSLNWDSFFSMLAFGGRVHLLKDPIETVPEGRVKRLKLKIAHYTLMTFLVLICLQISICIFYP